MTPDLREYRDVKTGTGHYNTCIPHCIYSRTAFFIRRFTKIFPECVQFSLLALRQTVEGERQMSREVAKLAKDEEGENSSFDLIVFTLRLRAFA
ncbi:MAG: hypothetical protein WD065_11945 [Planctomycetaceae bacterium]